MKIVKQSWCFQSEPLDGNFVMKKLEYAGRTCYQSHNKMSPHSHFDFLKRAIDNHHHSIIEHVSASVEINNIKMCIG